MATVLFPSGEWIDAWVKLTNADDAFRLAGQGWRGSVGCAVRPDQAFAGPTFYLRLEGHGGVWSHHRWGSDANLLTDATFNINANYLVWKGVISQDLKPVRGIISGRVRVSGQLSDLLRWSRALTRLAELAGQLETTFIDEVAP